MAEFENRNRNRNRSGQGATNPRREARAKAAERHVADMEARWAKEIERSLAGVREFDGMPASAAAKLAPAPAPEPEEEVAETVEAAEEIAAEAVAEVVEAPAEDAPAEAAEDVETAGADESAKAEAAAEEGADADTAAEALAPKLPTVTVVNANATQAVLENGRGYAQFCDLALLDFASFVNPGGGYIRGAFAQEECLCADSFLYNVLKEKRSWYQENRRRNINCELYRNRGLVVPAVRFEHGKMHAYADVLVVAAPNTKRAREEYSLSDAQIESAMRDRVRFVLALCDEIGRTKLVAGAFGCGAFGGNAEAVAEIFREELTSGRWGVEQVIFAVPESRWDENLPVFKHVLGSFPVKNEESYADAAARVAATKAEQAAAAAAEEDDDDDDWRKYL